MDIHAHHLHKAPGEKAWHYFFEFLMLFLAVLCGFLAEYRLEHRIERDREREFIASAVREMKLDFIQVKDVENDSDRYKMQDTLAVLLLSGDRSQKTINKMYNLYFNYLYEGSYAGFKSGTLSQLKNAGNMRLIRKSAVVDSLLGWDGAITHSFKVYDDYCKLVYDNLMMGSRIFDGGYFVQYDKWITVNEGFSAKKSIRFLTNDESLLHELGTNIKNQAMTLKDYHKCIFMHKTYTTRLIDFFEKEYNLKDL
jgi:hypothetical protein